MGSDFFVFFFPLEVFLGFVGSPSTTIGAGKKGERVKYWKAGYFVGLKFKKRIMTVFA